MSNPWGLKDIQPGSLKTISDNKLATFAVGQQKKSRFQKAREEAEERKRQEALETSKMYDTFVASFEGDEGGGKTFVRASSSVEQARAGSRGSDVYRLNDRGQGSPAVAVAPSKPLKEMDRMLLDFKEREEERTSRGSSRSSSWATEPKEPPSRDVIVSAGGLRAKPKGDIDVFLNEIMNSETGHSVASALGNIPGSFDSGDGTTTNLYVGNLAPSVTEERLLELFGAFGPINSVKVMWPRSVEEKAKKRNCGFVSFMKRADAEDAKNELNDSDLDGQLMSVGWGKAVKLNAFPVPMPGASVSVPVAAVMAPSLPRASPVQPLGGPPIPPGPPPVAIAGRWDSRPQAQVLDDVSSAIKVIVRIPDRKDIQNLIDLTARYVAIDGDMFEQAVKSRVQGDSRYSFLFNSDSADGHYYRWRTFANVMGDDDRLWREEPFIMLPGSPPVLWVPPKVPSDRSARSRSRGRARRSHSRERRGSGRREDDRGAVRRRSRSRSRSPRRRRRSNSRERYAGMTGAQIERERAKSKHSKEMSLTDMEYEEFENIINTLTISRANILNGMVFALDFADMAAEIVDMLKKSLLNISTAAPLKIARLYLLSDILHNSGANVKGATSYRMMIQTHLPEIFGHLNKAYRCVTGRMTARQVEDRVLTLLDVWSRWSLLSPVFLWGLEAVFRMTDTDWACMSRPLSAEDTPPAPEDLEWDRLRRRARIAGVSEIYWESPTGKESEPTDLLQEVAVNPVQMSPMQLFRTLHYVNEFVKKKTMTEDTAYNPSSAADEVEGSPAAGAAVPIDSGEVDIDGIPIDADDDIDGIPIDADDGIDGIPIDADDGIDGIPIDADGDPIDATAETDPFASFDIQRYVDSQVLEYKSTLLCTLNDSSQLGELLGIRRAELLQQFDQYASKEQSHKRHRSPSADSASAPSRSPKRSR